MISAVSTKNKVHFLINRARNLISEITHLYHTNLDKFDHLLFITLYTIKFTSNIY